MSLKRQTLVVLFFTLLSFNLWAQSQLTVKDFFKNPPESAHAISPDGKRLAYLKPFESRMNIYVRDLNDAKSEKRLTELKDRDIAQFFWKGNETLLFSKDFNGDENFHIFAVDVKDAKAKDLTNYEKTRAAVIDTLENISPKEILVQHNRRNKEIFDVYRINAANGKSKLVAENPGSVTGWVTDNNGKVRMALQADGLKTHVLYRKSESEKFKKILTFGHRESFSPEYFTADNQKIYALSNLGRDRISLVEFDPVTAKETKIIYQHSEVDIDSVTFNKDKKALESVSYITWKREVSFFDLELEKNFNSILEKIPQGEEIRYVSADKKQKTFIARTYSDRSFGGVYLFDSALNKLTEVISFRQLLPIEKMSEMQPIKYKSRDGLTIHGYISKPVGAGDKNLPVVVRVHGGPWARDEWGFQREVQFLTNSGFAVFSMNFRGSTGYGKKFFEASFKQWGLKMNDDITDGVRWLISEGIANPKKICIYGGSYGGYATLSALTTNPELYKCGVNYVGVSNLFTFMKTIPPYWKTELEKIYEMVGHPELDKEQMIKTSPALNADKLNTPLFVAQGAQDPRVNKAESDQIVEALKKRGIDVPYMVKENEGHGFRNEENRFDFYNAMEKFLSKYLK
jgi:dipeptidyl aminopeptidase/acylaminoacyl peptidase